MWEGGCYTLLLFGGSGGFESQFLVWQKSPYLVWDGGFKSLFCLENREAASHNIFLGGEDKRYFAALLCDSSGESGGCESQYIGWERGFNILCCTALRFIWGIRRLLVSCVGGKREEAAAQCTILQYTID